MVNQSMARFAVVLVLVAVTIVTTSNSTAAQNGACPSSTVTMGNAAGTWPGSMAACRSLDPQYGTQYSIESVGGWPCDQGYAFYTTHLWPLSGGTDGGFFYMSPPTWATDSVRVRFYLTQDLSTLPGLPAHRDLQPGTLVIRSYDAQGFNVATRSMHILNDSHIQIIEVPSQMMWPSYTLYFVDTYINWSAGGWLRFHFVTDEPDEIVAWALSSVQVGRYSDFDSFPAMCDIPNVGPPATPTPHWTPPPAGTPSPTPPPVGTIYPTSPAGTAFPTRTPAPVAFPTAPSEPTPTPWPAYTLPSVQFPSLSFPAIPTTMSMAVPTAGSNPPVPTVVSGQPNEVVTRIHELRAEWEDSYQDSQAASSVFTDTTGVGAPKALARSLVQNISQPIAYAKSLGVYMPNAAPYMAWLLIMAGMVLFSVIAKPMIGVTKVLFELIRRLWEAIPLN